MLGLAGASPQVCVFISMNHHKGGRQKDYYSVKVSHSRAFTFNVDSGKTELFLITPPGFCRTMAASRRKKRRS